MADKELARDLGFLTRDSAVSQALFGSLPETIGEEVDATVAMVRGPAETTRSIREAIVERFGSGETATGSGSRSDRAPSPDEGS